MKTRGGELSVLFCVWSSLPVTFVSLRAAVAQAPAPPPAQVAVTVTDARALASEGRRLMNGGRWALAKEKLEQATADPKADSEWVFDLGHCLARMGKDDEALKAFQKYLTLPLTLRAAEAERRIAAIEGRRKPIIAVSDEPKKAPRYVLVPTKVDNGKCVESCNAPSTCGRFVGAPGAQQCEAARFSCMRGCAGARVHRGICPDLAAKEGETCFVDRGWGWPKPSVYNPRSF